MVENKRLNLSHGEGEPHNRFFDATPIDQLDQEPSPDRTRDLMTPCLILACGNTLREDDGIGPFLARWAEERFADEPRVRIIARHQWTPELAQDLAEAQAALFIDCATDTAPGAVRISPVEPAEGVRSGLGTHHLGAAELLALSKELFGKMPLSALLLTVGAGSLELREGFSTPVQSALPQAFAQLEKAVEHMLSASRA
jgi:hydrogenase maturation protease